tara:strand:+ start:271 stop:708 length:438 start_codon:yes stop_codon:yes gene_type:complete
MKNLYTKLLDVTSKIEKLEKDKKNPFFKSSYVSLDKVIDVVRPHLLAEKLLLIQPIEQGCVGTRIICTESNKSIDSFIPLPENVKPQDLGSCITYFRRYTLVSLLGLSQEDDDGNKAHGRTKTAKNKMPARARDMKDAMLDDLPF